MKKIISVILIAVSLLLLPSCSSNISYDEAEVIAAAKDLIKKAEKYNDIFWGDGIPYLEDNNYRNGNYYAADIISLDDMGISRIDDLYLNAAKIYSEDYLEDILISVFGISGGEYYNNGLVRYYQETEYIMVNSAYSPLLVDEVEYLYNTLEVVGSDSDTVFIKIMIKVTRVEGEEVLTQTREKEIDLVKENGIWLLDSPTYANYRPTELSK